MFKETARLKFGIFKGEKLEETPIWYQNWLNNQEWYNNKYINNGNRKKEN